MQQAQPSGDFDALAFSAAELQALKAVARVRGTYYQGAVTFDGSRRIPDGVVFVDTRNRPAHHRCDARHRSRGGHGR